MDEGDEYVVRVTWPPDSAAEWKGGITNIFALNFDQTLFVIRAGHAMQPVIMDKADLDKIGSTLEVLPVARLVMTPPSLKQLRTFIDDQITKYESVFGPIEEAQ